MDVIHRIETGEIVLAFSLSLALWLLIIQNLYFSICYIFFFLSELFWMRKNISIKICSFPGAKWLEYTPGCRSDKESFWTISNFYKASVSLLNREILYARTKVPSQLYNLFPRMTTFLNVVWECMLSGSRQLKWSLIYCANTGQDAQPVMQNGNNSSHDLLFLSALCAYPPQLIPAGWKRNEWWVCMPRQWTAGSPKQVWNVYGPKISKIAYLKPAQVGSNMLYWHNFQDRHSCCFLCYLCPGKWETAKILSFPHFHLDRWLYSSGNCL